MTDALDGDQSKEPLLETYVIPPNVVRNGLFEALRHIEASAPDRPPIGTSERLEHDIVSLTQVPSMDFPGAGITMSTDKRGRPLLHQQMFGLFGLQGALPLAHTREAAEWHEKGETAFTDFVTLLSTRLMQLRYRVWADGRAIRQYAHPGETGFEEVLEATLGEAYLPTPRDRRLRRLRHAGLASSRVRGAARLREMIRSHFRINADVREFLPKRLHFEPEDLTQLGRRPKSRHAHHLLGGAAKLGKSAPSLAHRIGIDVHVPDFESYCTFLPRGANYNELRDLVLGFIGPTVEVELSLWLPAGAAPRARLGKSAPKAAEPKAPSAQACLSRHAALPVERGSIDPLTTSADLPSLPPSSARKPTVDHLRPLTRITFTRTTSTATL